MSRMASMMREQKRYYSETAHMYDALHIIKNDEHEKAIRFLLGWLPIVDAKTILDVGAGTGRFQRFAKELDIEIDIVGLEPVRRMREHGHAAGIPVEKLIYGNATALPFEDNAFDIAVEFGMLHHVKKSHTAIREMCRVSSKGIFISDSNHLAAGSLLSRMIKNFAWSAGLWSFIFRLSCFGKSYRYTEDDGIWYWYTVLDSIPEIRKKFPNIYILTTKSVETASLRWSARNLAVLATK